MIETGSPLGERTAQEEHGMKRYGQRINTVNPGVSLIKAAPAELSLAGNNCQDSIGKCRTIRGMLTTINSKISGAAISVSRKK
jgi:hypothetical protein